MEDMKIENAVIIAKQMNASLIGKNKQPDQTLYPK